MSLFRVLLHPFVTAAPSSPKTSERLPRGLTAREELLYRFRFELRAELAGLVPERKLRQVIRKVRSSNARSTTVRR